MPLIRAIEWYGRKQTRILLEVGGFASYVIQTIAQCLRPPWRLRLIIEQAFYLGNKAMPIAMLTALFVGMVIVLQAGYQLADINATQYAAAGAAKGLTQIMIPIFTALVVGARTAASIAAELGTMRVTEQIDAMEVLDVDPRAYLIVPRVIAATIMLPVITLYGDVVGLTGGMIMGHYNLGIPFRYYWAITVRYLEFTDFITGFLKTFFFGAAMGLCGCYFGFKARGGAEGVGRATTQAVVFTLTLLVLLEYLLSSWSIYIIDTFIKRPLG
ncbi:MAG: ABC transporter permease [bacterium]|nr:ABC transporter permease [bacterium]